MKTKQQDFVSKQGKFVSKFEKAGGIKRFFLKRLHPIRTDLMLRQVASEIGEIKRLRNRNIDINTRNIMLTIENKYVRAENRVMKKTVVENYETFVPFNEIAPLIKGKNGEKDLLEWLGKKCFPTEQGYNFAKRIKKIKKVLDLSWLGKLKFRLDVYDELKRSCAFQKDEIAVLNATLEQQGERLKRIELEKFDVEQERDSIIRQIKIVIDKQDKDQNAEKEIENLKRQIEIIEDRQKPKQEKKEKK